MTNEVERIRLLPNVPAVYALYGGRDNSLYVAYIGVADRLRNRIDQRLVRRDSSVASRYAAVGLNPDQVTELRWWTDASFADRSQLEAAELVAFDALEPALRSRGRVQEPSRILHADPAFHDRLRIQFTGPSSGRLVLPNLQDALDRIAALQRQVDELTRRIDNLGVQ